MSHIKRMKLKGFKSFSNPTVLTFEEGFNTVVGANGSGKSNVFDALCFVLGRMSSKELRTEKLGNLVFNGGKNLKPAKEAEVSIYLTNDNKELLNTDVDEVKITRIVTNQGKSKYLLNNQKVTRTEIVEVLRRAHIDPDGYNIILQGDIMRIVNMTPNERRELIEEISNVSGYEDKKQKAVKKLDKVELDLKEADLLMEEKTKYLKELKSEKEQAEKYHDAKEDLRFNGLLLIKSKIIRNVQIKKKKEEDLEKAELELSKYKEKLNDFEIEVKEIDESIVSLEKEIEIKSHDDFILVTNKITELDAKLLSLKEKRAENKKQIVELKTKNKGLVSNINSNKSQIKKIEVEILNFEKDKKLVEKNLKEVEEKLSKLKGGISSDAFEKIDDLENDIEELNQKKYDKNLIKQDNSIQIEKLNTKLEHLEEERTKIESNINSNKEQVISLEKNRKELKNLIVEVSDKANKSSEIAAKVNSLSREYSTLVEDHTRMKMKLNSSREAIATNRAVDTISKLKSNDSSIFGTVAELASVPEKYSMALETAAGKSLFNVVVDNDKTAVKYINYLKEKRIGSATFLPLNKVGANARLDSSVLSKKGVVDYALNLIKFDSRYEKIFNLIFGDLLVIESVEDAKNIGIGQYKMVTLDGDLVMKSGAMSGGFRSRKKGLGLFKDDKLEKRVSELDNKIISLKSTLDLLKEEKESCEKELYDLRHNKIEVEGEVAKLEKVLEVEGKDSSLINSEIENILSDKVVIENSLKKIDREIFDLDEKINKLKSEKDKLKITSGSGSNVMSQINDFEYKREEIREELRSIMSQIDTRNIQLKNVLIPEVSNLNKFLVEGEAALSRLEESTNELTKEIDLIEIELKDYKIQEKELSKDYKGLISKRDEFREKKKKLEVKYEKEFTTFDKFKEKCSQIRYSIGEFETLNGSLNDDLELFFNEVKTELEIENREFRVKELLDEVENALNSMNLDVKELQNKVNNLKSKISSFGSINMKAVEIYDKLNEEFNKLLEKRQTLNEERNEILDFISEMDEKKKERFMETFAHLEKHFINIFSKLSSKGQVEILIEDEKDLWNSGVLIRVKLSEKNYLDIKSLSGGEKTITAVAFIFAVQEFNPASFYIFDEIDAALDIMNCEKLGKLVRENAHKAQYIVVSHSEHFIQSAQSIYGVTMDKNKISSILSLDLADMKDYVDEEVVSS